MRPLLHALLMFIGLLGGCATRTPRVDTQVRAIRFHDNGPWLSARSDAALRQAMGHPKPSGIWPLRRTATLDEDTLNDDERRLAVHYAHQGFFDAELVHWDFREVREANDKRPPVVVLVGTIDPGEPTTVSAVEIASDDLSPPAQAVVDRELRRGEGKRFLLSTHQGAMASAEQVMGNLSFAHANVGGEVEVDRPRKEAVRRYDVVPGPPSTFGAITVDEGEGTIPDSVFRRQLKIAEGESYNLDQMSLTRRRLYSLGVFSSVEVEPQLEDSGDVVPVAIRMVPRDPRGLLFGVGLALEGGRQQALGRFRFEHVNIAHKLLTFELEATGGYALLSSSIPTSTTDLSTFRGGPVVDVSAATSAPVLGWQARLEAAYLRNVTEAFVTSQPSTTTSLSGPLAPHWTLTLAYRLRYTSYFDLQVDLRELAALEGSPDLLQGTTFDAHLEQTLLWDTRDDPLAPTSGWRHSLTLREAGRAVGGNYDYLGAQAEFRGYRGIGRLVGSVRRRLIVAGRLGGGYLQPYGPPERRAVPIAERLTLGGSGSVRGWIYQHLGPYICSLESVQRCDSEPGVAPPDGVDTVPVGGLASTIGSVELRHQGERFGGVAFTDVGMVWEDVAQIRRLPPLASVGVGARMKTPVGPLRADIAMRTDNNIMFAQEPRVWFHIGIGEAF